MNAKSAPLAFNSWRGMRERCNNKNHSLFHRYGGRGITVCKRWDKFENFLADMGERKKEMSIERIDNDKGYYPTNCKWATRSEQMRNRSSKVVHLTFNGRTMVLTDWAEEIGMSLVGLWTRLYRYKWSVERSLTEPRHPQGRRS